MKNRISLQLVPWALWLHRLHVVPANNKDICHCTGNPQELSLVLITIQWRACTTRWTIDEIHCYWLSCWLAHRRTCFWSIFNHNYYVIRQIKVAVNTVWIWWALWIANLQTWTYKEAMNNTDNKCLMLTVTYLWIYTIFTDRTTISIITFTSVAFTVALSIALWWQGSNKQQLVYTQQMILWI